MIAKILRVGERSEKKPDDLARRALDGNTDGQWDYGAYLFNSARTDKQRAEGLFWLKLVSNRLYHRRAFWNDYVKPELTPQQDEILNQLAIQCADQSFKNCTSSASIFVADTGLVMPDRFSRTSPTRRIVATQTVPRLQLPPDLENRAINGDSEAQWDLGALMFNNSRSGEDRAIGLAWMRLAGSGSRAARDLWQTDIEPILNAFDETTLDRLISRCKEASRSGDCSNIKSAGIREFEAVAPYLNLNAS